MDLLRPIRESAFVNRIASTLSRRLVDKGLPANVRAEKLAHFQRAFAFFEFNGIQGDILEFGVSTGRAMALIERCAKKVLKGENAKYRLFDFVPCIAKAFRRSVSRGSQPVGICATPRHRPRSTSRSTR